MSGHSELGEFLRARREALRPADVGLPDSGRRRTPGLRREEVATLADVSVDYVVRLEQGRDANPSPSVQSALARALRLSSAERHHLAVLAAHTNHPEACPPTPPVRAELDPAVQLLLDHIDVPAFAVGPASDVVGWNGRWQRVVESLGLLDAPVPNLARYVFLDPRAHTTFPEWDAVATEQASRLRGAALRWSDDPVFAALLAELHPIAEFARRWQTNDVAHELRTQERLVHPQFGELKVLRVALSTTAGDTLEVSTWLPGDAATASVFLVGDRVDDADGPPHLRIVGDG